MMKDKQPILSICIPTYNRAEILRDTLSQYVACMEFDDEVELIISDNASPDHTQEVCNEFVEKYKNIHYYRNDENVRDENFIIVQNYARGRYIKIMNDNIYMPNKAIGKMKEYIRSNAESKTPLFFVTGPIYQRMRTHEYTCNSLDAFVQKVSLYITALSVFGNWKTDWEQIQEKYKFSKLQLSQVDWAYQILERRGSCKLIYMEPFWLLSKGAEHKYSGSYNFFQVHLTNYNIIKQSYADKGLISTKTMRTDGRGFLQHYRKKIWNTLLSRKNDVFDYTQTYSILKENYKSDPYFYWYMITFPVWYLGDLVRRMRNKLRKIIKN